MANLYQEARLMDWRNERARLMREQNLALGWRPVESAPIAAPPMEHIQRTAAQAAAPFPYPKPRNLSKRGMHWSASCYPEEHGWRENLALCRDMGMGYIKFVDDGGASGLNVYRACWHEFGMIPVIRFYIGTPGQCGQREDDAIRRISNELGFATYFELCNEPDLPIEWGGHQPKDWLYQACWAFCDYAPKVIAAGGLPGTFALASGAFSNLRIDQWGNEIPPVKVNFLKLITDRIGTWVFEHGGWIAMHNYPINHPVDYPNDAVNQTGKQLTKAEYDAAPPWAWDHRPMADINAQRARDKNPGDDIYDDDTCVRAYIPFQDQLKEIGLPNVEMDTTEGGYTVTRGDDGRYFKTYEEWHPTGTEQINREIGPIQNYGFYCKWLLYNTTGGWATDCYVGGSHNYSRTIALLKSTPVGAWGEKHGALPLPDPGDPPPTPPPDPPEEEPQVPEPVTVYEPADVLARYGLTLTHAAVTPGETYWKIVRVKHLSPTENNGQHNAFFDVKDRNGQRVNGAKIAWGWQGGPGDFRVTIDKPANEPGANVPIDSVRQIIWADVYDDLDSDRIAGISSNHPDEPPVTAWGHPGNAVGHHSFLIEWQLCEAATATEPEPDPEPEDPPVTPPVEQVTSQTLTCTGEITLIRRGDKVIDVAILFKNVT